MHPLLQGRVRPFGPGKVRGRLYQIQDYPGMVPAVLSEEWVIGEVFELMNPAQMLPELDRYEECGTQEQPGEYSRHLTDVQMDTGADFRAWIYRYEGAVQPAKMIPSGTFVKSKT